MSSAPAHPDDVLHGAGRAPAPLPPVDHYAGNERRLLRALALQRDLALPARPGRAPVVTVDVTADCEDGAPVGHELAHARLLGELIASADNAFDRVGLRVHPVDDPHFRTDVELVMQAAGRRLAYVMVPKVDSAADVDRAVATIDAAAALHADDRRVPVHVLIETLAGLAAVDAIAAHPRVESLSFGIMDFVSEFRGLLPDDAMASPAQFEHPLVRDAKVRIALAAHRHGRVPSHSVCTALDDPAQARDDARRASREFGFARMWSIHPSQPEAILEGLRPDADGILDSAAILLAARDAHWAPIRHDGRLHDRASYRHHWHRLQRARATGAQLPEAAIHAFFDNDPA